jgi:hypothetical protein
MPESIRKISNLIHSATAGLATKTHTDLPGRYPYLIHASKVRIRF